MYSLDDWKFIIIACIILCLALMLGMTIGNGFIPRS